MRQEWLIPYENPLAKRLGVELFKSAPKTPGVYTMFGLGGHVLYIGKAKDLRARLNSYKRARPDQVSRKVIRLLNVVEGIRWEVCESEEAALLRENQLLRDMRPPFNVVNTRPDTYYFIGVKLFENEIRFRLTTNPRKQADLLFGAYKGRGLVRDGYAALLRLVWAAQAPATPRFEFPARLTRYQPPYLYSTTFRPDWFPLLKKFLNGTDDSLLPELTVGLLQNEALPRFVYGMIQDDLETALEFFNVCPARNRRLKKAGGYRSRVIPQEKIDDLIVLDRLRGRKQHEE
jgi:hypothetical protein